MFNYSKVAIKPYTVTDGDETRTYRGYKLSSLVIMREGFKLVKAIVPSIGVGIDEVSNSDEVSLPNTFGAAFTMLNENLSEEHFDDLAGKLLGNLTCNGEPIEDIGAHFDQHPNDLIDVLLHMGEQNFHGFFTQSNTVNSLLKKLKEILPSQKVNDLIESVKNSNEQDTNEQG